MAQALSHRIAGRFVQAIYTTGCTTLASSAVDMAGYDGALFTHVTGNTTSTVTFLVQGSATTATTDYVAISGATVNSTAATRLLQVDLYRPGFRYLRAVTNSTGTANTGAIICQQYDSRTSPTTSASTDVVSSVVVYNGTT